jgi:hypothetical protein
VRQEVAHLVEHLMLEKAAMLSAYFGLDIDEQGCLKSLPQLIEGYAPDLSYLPQFVLNLARGVDWESEQLCFQGIAQVRHFGLGERGGRGDNVSRLCRVNFNYGGGHTAHFNMKN